MPWLGWKRERARGHGRRRAAFWAKLGHPNLVRARARWREIREERKRVAAMQAVLEGKQETTLTRQVERKRDRL